MIKRIPVLLALSLLVGQAVASTQLLSDSKAVRNFINEMVEQHAFTASELQAVFDEANLHQSILDAFLVLQKVNPGLNTAPFLSLPLAAKAA